MDSYARKHNRVEVGNLTLEVTEYKIDHASGVNSYFTLSGDTGMYVSGIKPYVLTLKGYFPKGEKSNYTLKLENLLYTAEGLNFTLDGLAIENAVASRYAFKDTVSSMVQEVELTLMGVGEVKEEVSSDE
jgi:hypothetical protein